MIFTMTKLKQPLLAHPGIGLGRGAIDPDPIAFQLIDAQYPIIEGGFKIAPGLCLRERIKYSRQPIIAEVQRPNALVQRGRQRVEMFFHPGLDVRETVVALRDDEGQPHGDHLAKAQFALPVTVGRKELVEQGRNMHFLQVSQQHGYVVNSFDFNQTDNLVNHTSRLSDIFNSQKSLLI